MRGAPCFQKNSARYKREMGWGRLLNSCHTAININTQVASAIQTRKIASISPQTILVVVCTEYRNGNDVDEGGYWRTFKKVGSGTATSKWGKLQQYIHIYVCFKLKKPDLIHDFALNKCIGNDQCGQVKRLYLFHSRKKHQLLQLILPENFSHFCWMIQIKTLYFIPIW